MIDPVSEAFTTGYRPLPQRHDGDDQLRRVAEGGVQQAADALAGVMRQFLGGVAQPPRQRHDRQACGDKDQGVGSGHQELQPDRDRNKDQQPVQHVASSMPAA